MSKRGANKRLFCIRHAKSSWDDPALADRQRPLNGRGRRDAPKMGKRLAHRRVKPDLIISSPAERARTTARAIARELAYPEAQIMEADELYFCGPDAMLEIIHRLRDDINVVFCVSHNPDISDFVSKLAIVEINDIPTCAVAEIAFDAVSWSAIDYGFGELLELDFPKKQ